MSFYKLFALIALLVVFSSCEEEVTNVNNLFSVTIKDQKKKYTTEESIEVSIVNKKQKEISSITYTIDDLSVSANASEVKTLSLSEKKLGKRSVTATVIVDDKPYTVSKDFIIVASKSPKLYSYKILETYPHDSNAYTQGLEFKGDTLYESTGQRKESTLRKVAYTTGEVLQNVALQDQYFGEGLTILNNKIYQLTWQSKTGFIYDINTLERTGTFVYGKSKEGWGLANDGSKIYKSDGTEKIWTLNAETLAEEDYIEIYTNKSKIDSVNELEYVDGKIYANIYQKDAIAIVNPSNGAVEGVINLKSLKEKVTQHPKLDVLNGIAYKGEPNILYVTGKNWDKLFKIEIVEN